jgi:hypothetical protein
MRAVICGKAICIGLQLSLLISSAGAVCMTPQPRLVCAEYFKEQTVVIAQLVRSSYVDRKNDEAMDYHLYFMRSKEVIRGRIDPEFRIYEENSSGRAGFDWKEGETYLLFLSYSRQDRGWELDGCGNSGPVSKSAAALKEIKKIKAATSATGGTISGTIWLEAGVSVSATGNLGTFRTISDREGRFSMHVPAGKYSVHVRERGSRFAPDDLSYELPSNVHVENGGCVQIQFDWLEPGKAPRPSDRPRRWH